VPEKKKQHFVPQFYMRNFSPDADRKRISLYLVDAQRHVAQAAIRDQACENYFYGKDGVVEEVLSRLEGQTSPLIAKAIADKVLPDRMGEDHLTLLTFVLFQGARTPVMAAAMNEGAEKLARMFAKEFPDLKDRAEGMRLRFKESPVTALQISLEIRRFALDLQWKILENKTPRVFITSDNPAVTYNQFLERRNPRARNTGLVSKGLQIFLPLSPHHMLMLYDSNVYRIGRREHMKTHVGVTREPDVMALNTLQAANADQVLYFSPDTDLSHVEEAVARAKPHRRSEHVELSKHPAVGPDGKWGTIIKETIIDLRLGLSLDFSAILSAAAGARLRDHEVQLRDPERIRRFEESRLPAGPCDPRKFVESCLGE
jgi:hypothetical protein